MSDAVKNKMRNHLWYFAEDLIAREIFDAKVSDEKKKKMVLRLESGKPNVIFKWKLMAERHSVLIGVQFIYTKLFLERFDLSAEVLEFDPSTWESRADLQDAQISKMGVSSVENC